MSQDQIISPAKINLFNQTTQLESLLVDHLSEIALKYFHFPQNKPTPDSIQQSLNTAIKLGYLVANVAQAHEDSITYERWNIPVLVAEKGDISSLKRVIDEYAIECLSDESMEDYVDIYFEYTDEEIIGLSDLSTDVLKEKIFLGLALRRLSSSIALYEEPQSTSIAEQNLLRLSEAKHNIISFVKSPTFRSRNKEIALSYVLDLVFAYSSFEDGAYWKNLYHDTIESEDAKYEKLIKALLNKINKLELQHDASQLDYLNSLKLVVSVIDSN